MRRFAYEPLVVLLGLTMASSSASGTALIMLTDAGTGLNVTITDGGGCVGTGCGSFSTSSPGVFDLAPAIGQVVVVVGNTRLLQRIDDIQGSHRSSDSAIAAEVDQSSHFR